MLQSYQNHTVHRNDQTSPCWGIHTTPQCLVRSSTMQPMRSWHPSGSWHPLQVRTLFTKCHMCEEAGGTAVWNTGNQILQRSVGYAACSVRSHSEHFRLHLLEVKMRTFTSFTSVIGSCSKTPLLPTPRCKGGKVGRCTKQWPIYCNPLWLWFTYFLQKRHSESGMQLEPPAFVTTLGPWQGLQWAEETMQRDTVPLLVVYRYGGFVWFGNHQNISRALKLVRNQNMFPSASICFHLLPPCSWQNTCHLHGTSSVSITISDDKLLKIEACAECFNQLSRGVPGKPAAFIVGLDDVPVFSCDNEVHSAAGSHRSHQCSTDFIVYVVFHSD